MTVYSVIDATQRCVNLQHKLVLYMGVEHSNKCQDI